MNYKIIYIQGIKSSDCMVDIENKLKESNVKYEIDYLSNAIYIEDNIKFDDYVDAIESLGYRVSYNAFDRRITISFLLSFLLFFLNFLYPFFASSFVIYIIISLYSLILVYILYAIIWPIQLKWNIKWLIFIAIIVSYIHDLLSNKVFIESSVFIFIYLLGRCLEFLMKNRAREYMDSIIATRDNIYVTRLNQQNMIENINIADINIGDVLLIKSGYTFNVNGVVVNGTSYVDNSSLTGESKPVKITVGDNITPDMINLHGTIRVRVESSDARVTYQDIRNNIFSNIIHYKHEDLLSKIIKYLMKLGYPLAFLSFFIHWISGKTFIDSLDIFLSIILILFPCSLLVVKPLITYLVCKRLYKNGILIKDMRIFDLINRVKYLLIDKTGTITYGNFIISNMDYIEDCNEDNFIWYTYILNMYNNHYVSNAIDHYIKNKYHIFYNALDKRINDLIINDTYIKNGYGIKIDCNIGLLSMGRYEWMKECNNKLGKYDKTDKTDVYVSFNNVVVGVWSVSEDRIREDIFTLLNSVKKIFNRIKIIVVTGDTEFNSNVLKQNKNIDFVYSNLNPESKVYICKKYRPNIALGDGVNDAGLLSRSDIGISMFNGSDLTKQSGKIILLQNNLLLINYAVDILFRSSKLIRRLLLIGLFYNLLFIPYAVIGKLPVMISIAIMEAMFIVLFLSIYIFYKRINKK